MAVSFPDAGVCRDRYGLFNASFFDVWACSLCYFYIFHGKPLRYEPRFKFAHDIDPPLSPSVRGISLYQNLSDHVMSQHPPLCNELGEAGCLKLKLCCQNANRCCDRQRRERRRKAGQSDHVMSIPGQSSCPSTWDGYSCFHDTPAGQTVSFRCPVYIDFQTSEYGVATKTCTTNGTWWTDPADGREWTDYTRCVTLQEFRSLYIVGISCSAISLACLIPACLIFLRFKQLRRQHRIRIHLNLFASFILTNALWIGWDCVVVRNRAEQGETIPVLPDHVGLCRLLYVLTRYSWACNFLWMSLEGFHLYRLINHAFKTPKSIRHYYVIGWLTPSVPFCLYCVLRFWNEDAGCWIYNAGWWEWIVYGPNLLCILVNVAFLVNVLRILLTQLQSHPNEPSNYRRAFKATLILVPLFGLQLFLIVYRPYDDIAANIPFEIIAKIIGNSQVHNAFSGRGDRTHTHNSINELRSCTYSTTGIEHRQDTTRPVTESFPLKCARNGLGRRDLIGSESPVLSINSRGGSYSDSSRIHML